LHGVGQPVDVQQAGARRDLHQANLGARQFLLGLGIVAAVGPDAGDIRGGDEGADRARKARQPLAALPAPGQVFGQVRIGGGDDEGVDLVARHRGAQPGKAFGAQAGGVIDRLGGGHGCWHIGDALCCGFSKTPMIRRSVFPNQTERSGRHSDA